MGPRQRPGARKIKLNSHINAAAYAPDGKAIAVTEETLAGDYEAGAAAADKKYVNKVLEVEGTILPSPATDALFLKGTSNPQTGNAMLIRSIVLADGDHDRDPSDTAHASTNKIIYRGSGFAVVPALAIVDATCQRHDFLLL